MSYRLGVDVGTSKTAAAVWDGRHAVAVQLGNRSPAVPSVVLRTGDGTLLFGEAAERRAAAEPERVVREFKRRVGDQVPIVLGGAPYTAHRLMALFVEWVAGQAAYLYGGPPDDVVVSHPANWASYKRDLLTGALREIGIGARLVTEPEAAALHFAAGEGRVGPGGSVAVYDFGGGTFDAAVLRREATGCSVLGRPDGVEDLGGAEIDDVVLAHVWRSLGEPPPSGSSPADLATVTVLRRDAVEAKEHLSEDVEALIAVPGTAGPRRVVLRRSELEEGIEDQLERTITALERAVRRSGIAAADLSAIVLVGGSSRIPLVRELISRRFAAPVVLSSQPQLAVALGAAMTSPTASAPASRAPAGTPPAGTPPAGTPPAGTPPAGTPGWAPGSAATRAPEPDPTPTTVLADAPTAVMSATGTAAARAPAGPGAPSRTRWYARRRTAIAASAAAVVLVAGGVAAAAATLIGEPRAPSTAPTGTPTQDAVTPTTTPPTTAASRLLVVTVSGPTGAGRVTADAPGVECRVADCTFPLPIGTELTLRAVPRVDGARFRGWAGTCTGEDVCRLEVAVPGAPIEVTARFSLATGTADPPARTRRPAPTYTEVEPEPTERPTYETSPPEPTDRPTDEPTFTPDGDD